MIPDLFRPRLYSLRIAAAIAAAFASSAAAAEPGLKAPAPESWFNMPATSIAIAHVDAGDLVEPAAAPIDGRSSSVVVTPAEPKPSAPPRPFWSLDPAPAPELKFAIAVGECRFEKSPDGMWWQSDHENYSRYKNNRCGEIEVARKFDQAPALGWSIRYVTLGTAETNALASACPGDDCSKADRTIDQYRAECDKSFQANCVYHWRTVNQIKGLNFALNLEVARKGIFAAELEGGVFAYFLKSYGEVTSTRCRDDNCPWRESIVQQSGLLLSPMVGMTLRGGPFFVATRYYFRTSQHSPITAGISGGVQTWLVGVQTSF